MLTLPSILSLRRSLWFVLTAFFSAVIITGTLTSYPVVHAAGGVAHFTIVPSVYDPTNPITQSRFVLNLNPGTITNLSIRVTNTGTVTGSVNLYPADATTSQTTGIVYRGNSDPRTDVGAWVKLRALQLTLGPGQSEIVPFRLTIPQNVRSGQHAGGIVAEQVSTQTTTTKSNQFRLNIYYLFVLKVQITLPGPATEQLTARSIKAGGSSGYQSLLVAMSNTGNQMIKPTGDLKVSSAQGLLLQDLPVKMDTFLPDTSIDYPVYVQKKALTAGDYQVSLHLNYGHGKTLDYTTKLTITQDQVNQAFSNGPLQAPTSNTMMPLWQMILVALAALIILLMGGKKVYDLISARRKNTKGPTPPVDGSHSSMDTSKRRDKVA